MGGRCLVFQGDQESLFFFLIYFILTLQYCIGFAIYQNESATGIHVFPTFERWKLFWRWTVVMVTQKWNWKKKIFKKMELNSMPLNCILKIVKRVHFIFYILSLLENKWIYKKYWRNSFCFAYSCACPLCFEKSASCPLISWTSWMFLGTQPHPHFCFRLLPQSGNSADQGIFNTIHGDSDLTSSCSW